MSTAQPQTIFRHDYRTPAYLVDQVDLNFHLQPQATRVYATLQMGLNPDRQGVVEPLVLDGEHLTLLVVRLNGVELTPQDYHCDAASLTIFSPPPQFILELVTQIDPFNNTALEGLYQSHGIYCTQCEAQGFRRITYYPDRPDVLARFRVRIEGDNTSPVLLSNGNLVEKNRLDNGRHYAIWEDPFPKPSYLFALVAGDLVCLEDHYRTASGRRVLLQIYVEKRNRDDCDHAMQSLKKSMQWDEEVYGLEYDLDRYMIVAVDDFNMGAMENKGLNVFNSKYVLARPETATDNDYLNIEAVIAHEYFHNWTGNRVTCRDWFQLSLKEGLTVLRDQQFSADMHSAAIKRIDDVLLLRQYQFPEDAGPMAHPVRPDAYVEINNFYTTTIYNKGAEVIRMLETLLGRQTFVAGVRLYLQRHDGQAATCDDFVAALAEAGQIDLQVFSRWYSQAGTPEVEASAHYDPHRRTLTLDLQQSCPPTPGQPDKEPFHIPVLVGLIGADGHDLPLQLAGEAAPAGSSRVLELTAARQRFTFVGVEQPPVPSLLRGFSAPVRLRAAISAEDLAFRMAHDSDPFNRWEAGQQLAVTELLQLYHEPQVASESGLSPLFVAAWGAALADRAADCNLLARMLQLPSEQYLADQIDAFDPERLRDVREGALGQLRRAHHDLLLQRYHDYAQKSAYSLDPAVVGQRRLAHGCLALLMLQADAELAELCLLQYHNATNMTDRLAAFAALVDSDAAVRDQVIADFHEQWHAYPLLLDKWFSTLVLARRQDTFSTIEGLVQHPDFTLHNPNRARSVLGAFPQNLAVFHRPDGAGYRLLTEQIRLLDQRNPQVAARMATPLTRWRRLEPRRRELLQAQLVSLQQEQLSRDLYEIVNKSLA
ncbi:MAG: aminopeptidase N [Pelovirga sp.]